MKKDVWGVAEVKANFRKVVERANSLGPQIITCNGRKKAVMVSPEDWEVVVRQDDKLRQQAKRRK